MQCTIGEYQPGSIVVGESGRVSLVVSTSKDRAGYVTITYYAAYSDEYGEDGIVTCLAHCNMMVERKLIII